MKKIVLSFMLMLVAQLSFGQTITDFVNTFKENPGCQYLPVGKDMIPMVSSQAPDEVKPLFDKLTGLEMLMFMGAGEDLKKEVNAALAKLTENGYVAKGHDQDGMKGQVFCKPEGETLNDVLIVVDMGQGIMSMVMKGNFSVEDLKELNKMGE